MTAIDLHSHVLPGLDDGPADLAGSLALASTAVAAGTGVLAATPHIGTRYEVVPGELAGRVATLRAALTEARIPLEVVAGGELAPSVAGDLDEVDLRSIALGTGSCVLLECPGTRAGPLIPALVRHLGEAGFRVLLAHPERSPDFLRDHRLLAELVAGGTFVQVTAGSLRGDFGRTVRAYAQTLLREGLAHTVASDAHDARARPPQLVAVVDAAVQRAGLDPALTRHLTEHVPRALLCDAPLPPAPPPPRRRRPWLSVRA